MQFVTQHTACITFGVVAACRCKQELSAVLRQLQASQSRKAGIRKQVCESQNVGAFWYMQKASIEDRGTITSSYRIEIFWRQLGSFFPFFGYGIGINVYLCAALSCFIDMVLGLF